MPPKLRVEILIPTHYNADKTTGEIKPIETRKHRLVKNQIIEKFGGISIHPLTINGTWINPDTNERHFDQCYKYEVCINELENMDEYLEKWKGELKKLFEQYEIFMTYYPLQKI